MYSKWLDCFLFIKWTTGAVSFIFHLDIRLGPRLPSVFDDKTAQCEVWTVHILIIYTVYRSAGDYVVRCSPQCRLLHGQYAWGNMFRGYKSDTTQLAVRLERPSVLMMISLTKKCFLFVIHISILIVNACSVGK